MNSIDYYNQMIMDCEASTRVWKRDILLRNKVDAIVLTGAVVVTPSVVHTYSSDTISST